MVSKLLSTMGSARESKQKEQFVYRKREFQHWTETIKMGKPVFSKRKGRQEALAWYKEWIIVKIIQHPEHYNLNELTGMNLCCSCKPHKCHGDILKILHKVWQQKGKEKICKNVSMSNVVEETLQSLHKPTRSKQTEPCATNSEMQTSSSSSGGSTSEESDEEQTQRSEQMSITNKDDIPSKAELEKMVENTVKRVKPRRKPNRKPQPPKGKHNVFTHYPKDPNCPVCNQCKIQHQPCRVSKTKPESEEKPKKFGDRLTADHTINPHGKTGRKGETVALIIQDEATSWVQGYGCKTKSAEETKQCFQVFMGTAMKAKLVYTDNSQELSSALEILGWPHDPSTPYKPQTNGIAERAVRRVKEGTSCMLLQSGFCEFWWPNAMQLYCLYRCVIDVLIAEKQHT